MSSSSNSEEPRDPAVGTPRTGERSGLFGLLVGLLFAEAALMVALFGWLLFELVTVVPVSYASAMAIVVLVAIAACFVIAVAIGTIRRQSWVRGAALTWQILQIAIAVGCFQGLYARPDIGWALLVPSLVVIGLLFAPSVISTSASPRR